MNFFQGVCVRVEIGPRDMKQETARLVRRDTGEKSDHSWDSLTTVIPQLLETIHTSMLQKATTSLHDSIVKVRNLSSKIFSC